MDTGATGIAAFLDREAAASVVTEYVSTLDARDWAAYRALFTDRIAIDYGAIGSVVATIDADDWVDRCRALEGFDGTAHRLHNLIVTIDSNGATVKSVVDAAHFVTVDRQILMADIIGRYIHHLRRDNGWKIAGVTLSVVGYPTSEAAFKAVFLAARAQFAEGIAR